jgi:ABC-type amino acid transport substrate-binding protein
VIVSVETVEQGIHLLLKGRVDFAFTDNMSFFDKQKTNKEYAQLVFAQTPLLEVQLGVYFNTQCKYAGLLAPHLRKLEIKY